jgi:FKBP-type peptidyl-prolyl cis-trans isomerase SlyD
MARLVALVAVLALGAPLALHAQPGAAPTTTPSSSSTAAPAIENGATVELEYTLSDEAGAVLDTNKGQKPLTYTHGGQQIIPGLEKQLAGMHSGDVKRVTLRPEDAYGLVDPSAETEVPKESVPPDATVGTRLIARNAAGEGRPVVVKEIKDRTVVIDLNHPLAGKTLVFDVKVLSIEPAKPGAPPRPDATPKPGS